ncbi:MAG: transposase [Rhodobacter sp.]|nr:transposase [Rhodobacter sp.]MCA3479022.1 transposase [Rhodobacter sp.]
MWHHHYNNIRPHSSLGYRPPVQKALIPLDWRPTIH